MDNLLKIELFRQEIDRQAEEDAVALTTEMREKRHAASRTKVDIATRAALDDIKTMETHEVADFKRDMSRCDYELKKAVLTYRSSLIADFFAETERRLKAFAQSDDYAGYLKRSLEKIRASIAIDSATLIYARACDVDTVRSLTSCEVTADNTIRLGGLRAVCRQKNILCDVTLDMALDEEKRRFAAKKELRI